MTIISRIQLLVSIGATFLLGASVASAQPVTFTGKLRIGISDESNITGFRSNNAVPICAGAGTLVNTATVGTTLGTLRFNGVGSAAPGVGGAVTFHAVGAGFGGASERDFETCNVAIPGFANPRLRSRTQFGSAHFPGRKGPWTTMIRDAAIPSSPTATYMLSAGGGNPHPITVTAWTTTDEGGPVGTMGTPAPTAMNTFMGSAFEAPGVFTPLSFPIVARVQPGPARFGGGVPYSGRGGVQLGVVTSSGSFPPPPMYGQAPYANGFIPSGPQFFGTDQKGIDTTMHPGTPFNPPTTAPTPTFTKGLLFRRQDATYAFRTPGGSTQHDHGAIVTFNGGNTLSTMTGAFAPGIGIVTPIEFVGYNFEWTTGAVTHSDQIGDFFTVRKAQGYDIAVAASTAVAGETRRLQVVSPLSATIRPAGGLGIPLPALGFGGVAILQVDVIPAPEPTVPVMLGAALFFVSSLGVRVRRRRGEN